MDTGEELEYLFPEGMFVQEPQFIASPGAVAEDDGVILAQGFDGRKQKGLLYTRILIIDSALGMLELNKQTITGSKTLVSLVPRIVATMEDILERFYANLFVISYLVIVPYWDVEKQLFCFVLAFMVVIDAVNMELIGHVTATDIALFGLHNRLVGYTSFHLLLKMDTLPGWRK